MLRVGFVVFPGFQMMGLAMTTVFELANMLRGEPLYDVALVSENGGPIRSSMGMTFDSERFGTDAFDTLIVCATFETGKSSTPGLLSCLRAASPKTRRMAATCTGAFILAEAGLLDGKRVTTHWNYALALQSKYPAVKVDVDRIFVSDGPVWTSAGMTAGVDLALSMVESDLGEKLARDIARKLVVYHRRAGGQSQHSTLLELEPKSDRIQSALTYAKQNLHTPLKVEKLAEAAHLSLRQFSRAFVEETGHSPAKAIEKLRIETAKVLLEEGRHSIDVVARETGFADRDRMRRAFLRTYGYPPQVLRRRARTDTPLPPA